MFLPQSVLVRLLFVVLVFSFLSCHTHANKSKSKSSNDIGSMKQVDYKKNKSGKDSDTARQNAEASSKRPTCLQREEYTSRCLIAYQELQKKKWNQTFPIVPTDAVTAAYEGILYWLSSEDAAFYEQDLSELRARLNNLSIVPFFWEELDVDSLLKLKGKKKLKIADTEKLSSSWWFLVRIEGMESFQTSIEENEKGEWILRGRGGFAKDFEDFEVIAADNNQPLSERRMVSCDWRNERLRYFVLGWDLQESTTRFFLNDYTRGEISRDLREVTENELIEKCLQRCKPNSEPAK